MFSRFQRREFYRKVSLLGKCPFGALLHSFARAVHYGENLACQIHEYRDKGNP